MTTAALTPICDDIWEASHDLRMLPGVWFSCRMTVIKLSGGEVLIHSPVPLSEEVAQAIDAIGPVRYIVAPNLFHHLFLRDASERYPEAEVWGAPGLEVKRSGLKFDGILTRDEPGFAGELVPHFVAGCPLMNESLFYHRASKSLIMTDLLFNLQRPRGLLTPVVLFTMGTRGRLAQSRLWRMKVCEDALAAGESLKPVMRLDVSRLIVAHGDVVEGADTGARIEEALSWMLSHAKHERIAA